MEVSDVQHFGGEGGLLVVAGEDGVVRNAARKEGGEVHLFTVRLEELVWQETEIVVEATALAEAMAIATTPGIVIGADWNIVDGEALCVTSVRDDECEVDVRELKVVDQSFGSRMEVTAYSLDRNCEFAQAAWDEFKRERAGGRVPSRPRADEVPRDLI